MPSKVGASPCVVCAESAAELGDDGLPYCQFCWDEWTESEIKGNPIRDNPVDEEPHHPTSEVPPRLEALRVVRQSSADTHVGGNACFIFAVPYSSQSIRPPVLLRLAGGVLAGQTWIDFQILARHAWYGKHFVSGPASSPDDAGCGILSGQFMKNLCLHQGRW